MHGKADKGKPRNLVVTGLYIVERATRIELATFSLGS